MAYRILFVDGPEDGYSLVVDNPWSECRTERGNCYRAEVDEQGQPFVEERDAGDGNVECVTADGDSFLPPMQTIRMRYKAQGRMIP